ncbi:hypothetical protein MHU86_4597 [Fragilaria crotonensis]|nr:hypothetical protein MHU86_4597 [Fragilaria crotonensis]
MNLDRELNGTTTIRDDDDDSDAIVAVAMEALDDQITEAEYAAVAKQTWDRLKVAVVDYRGPGGLVENLVDLTKPMTPEKERLERDWDFRHAVRSRPAANSSTLARNQRESGRLM